MPSAEVPFAEVPFAPKMHIRAEILGANAHSWRELTRELRSAELKRAVTGISDSVLSERLAELVRAALVQRTVSEGPPVSVGYRLSPAGEALLPALIELTSWAANNLPIASGSK
jgi:DNA-binding HxlR family transcriptional regulator